MKSNISILVALAHGADEPFPDMQQSLSLAAAIHDTAHGFSGGIKTVADRMKLSVNTLTHKVNPLNTTHFLRPEELELLMHATGSVALLHAMAARQGYTLTRATPDQSGGDPNDAMMRSHMEYADFTRACVDPLRRVMQDESKAVTGNEVRRVEYHAQEVHAAVDHVLATLRGFARKAPEQQG